MSGPVSLAAQMTRSRAGETFCKRSLTERRGSGAVCWWFCACFVFCSCFWFGVVFGLLSGQLGLAPPHR
jgi:hypothetical protein